MDIILIIICILILLFALFMIFADADLTLLFYHTFYSPKDFGKEVVWITGASSGIGEYLAYSLVKRNARLALSGVNVERLQNVKKHCLVLYYVCDISELSKCPEDDVLLIPFSIQDFGQHEKCVSKVLEHFGQIDILINNAGVSQRADFGNTDIKVDINLFNVNIFGAVNLTRKVLKHFLERKKGHIVATSSMAGKIGAPYSSAYTGSKHAMHGYFECLRTELIHENIQVTIACPGPVFSRITDRCVTGKLGEVYGHVQQSSDKKMKTERCSELMVTAIANKVDECWITFQPLLLVLYLAQYIPSFYRNFILKRAFSKERVMKMRQGR